MSYSHEYYITHKEKYLESSKKYLAKKRAENEKEFLAKQNEYMKEYYLKNPDKRIAKREYDKEWRKNNPDYFRNYKKRKEEEKE